MLAVIKTGGKQYKVKVGDKIKIEKINLEPGKTHIFEEVLAMGDEKELKIGNPFIKGGKVEGKVIRTEKGKKVTGIKHKAKKRYKVKFGHRQMFSEVEITKI
jgi:large subunit ribosomal protein L21